MVKILKKILKNILTKIFDGSNFFPEGFVSLLFPEGKQTETTGKKILKNILTKIEEFKKELLFDFTI